MKDMATNAESLTEQLVSEKSVRRSAVAVATRAWQENVAIKRAFESAGFRVNFSRCHESIYTDISRQKIWKFPVTPDSLCAFSRTIPDLDIAEFNNWRSKPELAEAVAAIKALTAVMKLSQATTMMELEIELKKASDSLKASDETSISLAAGCDLFTRYVTRTSALEYEDFSSGKTRLIERGERFGEISFKAHKTIAMLGQYFLQDGSTILVHGFSRVVLALLRMAASKGKHFSVVCTEGRPDNTGIEIFQQILRFLLLWWALELV